MQEGISRLQIVIPMMLSVGAHFFMMSAIGLGGGGEPVSKIPLLHQNLVSVRFVNIPVAAPISPEHNPEQLAETMPAPRNFAGSAALASLAPAEENQPTDNAPALIALGNAAKPHYFRVRELTQKPVAVSEVQTYIASKPNDLAQPPTILRLYINEAGEVDEVETETTGLSSETIIVLRENFKKARFSPGRINELAVNSQIRIEVMLGNAVEKFELHHLTPPTSE